MTYDDKHDEYRDAIRTLDQLNSDPVPENAELLRRIELLERRLAELEDRVARNPYDPETLRRRLPWIIGMAVIFSILWLLLVLAML